MTKNGIRIKSEYNKEFLICALKVGLKVNKANVQESGFITYLITFKHVNQVFQLGYFFNKFI